MTNFIDEIANVVSESFQSYIGWFVAQLVLDALWPPFALIINIAFIVFTIFGLLAGLDEILESPTAVVFVLSVVSLAANVWLILKVG